MLLRAAVKDIIDPDTLGFDWEGYEFFTGRSRHTFSLAEILTALGYQQFPRYQPFHKTTVMDQRDEVLIDDAPYKIWLWLRETEQIDW